MVGIGRLRSLAVGVAPLRRVRDEHGFGGDSLDFVFLDHDKDAYLPDLQRSRDEGWLHPGSVVVADNIKLPGVPAYRSYMKDHEGTLWRTTEHRCARRISVVDQGCRSRVGIPVALGLKGCSGR
jgi:predicted O-methyltransferase YrrM